MPEKLAIPFNVHVFISWYKRGTKTTIKFDCYNTNSVNIIGESSKPTRLSSLSLNSSLLPPSTTMSELAVDVADAQGVFEAPLKR